MIPRESPDSLDGFSDQTSEASGARHPIVVTPATDQSDALEAVMEESLSFNSKVKASQRRQSEAYDKANEVAEDLYKDFQGYLERLERAKAEQMRPKMRGKLAAVKGLLKRGDSDCSDFVRNQLGCGVTKRPSNWSGWKNLRNRMFMNKLLTGFKNNDLDLVFSVLCSRIRKNRAYRKANDLILEELRKLDGAKVTRGSVLADLLPDNLPAVAEGPRRDGSGFDKFRAMKNRRQSACHDDRKKSGLDKFKSYVGGLPHGGDAPGGGHSDGRNPQRNDADLQNFLKNRRRSASHVRLQRRQSRALEVARMSRRRSLTRQNIRRQSVNLSVAGTPGGRRGSHAPQRVPVTELSRYLRPRRHTVTTRAAPRRPTSANYRLPFGSPRGSTVPEHRHSIAGAPRLQMMGRSQQPINPLGARTSQRSRPAGGCSHRRDGTMCSICEDIARLDRKTYRGGPMTIAARRAGMNGM